jgi:hypothetical protein
MEGGRLSGWGEEGADRLVAWDEVDVWSSDRLYSDLGLSSRSNPVMEDIGGLLSGLKWWLMGDLGCFLCFLYFTC